MAAAKGHSRSCYRISRTLAVFVAVQCVGLAFFIRGFLLTRVQLDATSPLDDLRVVDSAGAPGAPVLGHAPFDRAVLLVVDALRVDALVKQPYTVPGPHVEAMPGLRQLAHDLVRPPRDFNFQAVSDTKQSPIKHRPAIIHAVCIGPGGSGLHPVRHGP